MTETITGTDRSVGIRVTDLLDADTGPVDKILRAESRIGLRDGTLRIPARSYTSPNTKPAPAAVRHVGPDDDWTIASELGAAARIFQSAGSRSERRT